VHCYCYRHIIKKSRPNTFLTELFIDLPQWMSTGIIWDISGQFWSVLNVDLLPAILDFLHKPNQCIHLSSHGTV
jgi:hypothetical protein